MQYVNLISNDWNGTSKSKSAKHSKENMDSTEITVVLSNNGISYEKSIQMSTTLKSLFNGYADECGISLRSLRFSYNGRTLFLTMTKQ